MESSLRKDIDDRFSVVNRAPRVMEPQHRLEENVGLKGSETDGGVAENICNALPFRGRRKGGSESRFPAVTLCLLFLIMGIKTAQANRPPTFVLDGNVGSEIVVRMREGRGVQRGGGSYGKLRVLRLYIAVLITKCIPRHGGKF